MNERTERLLDILEKSVTDARFNGIDETHTSYWRVILDELDKESAPKTGNAVTKGE